MTTPRLVKAEIECASEHGEMKAVDLLETVDNLLVAGGHGHIRWPLEVAGRDETGVSAQVYRS